MKKYIFLFGLIILGLSAQSQVLISLLLGDKLNSDGLEFGLEGGVNYTNISGFDDTKLMPNFNLGFYFDIRMKNQWHLYTGVQVKSDFGMKNLSLADLERLDSKPAPVEGEYKQKVSNFMVPILINYKFKNHMYAELGPQVGLVYKGWVQFDSDVDGIETRIKDENDDLLNWFSGGFAVGAGYRLMKGEGWTIGVRYHQGLTRVFKDIPGTHSNSLHLKVNIPIGAGKSKKKKEEEQSSGDSKS